MKGIEMLCVSQASTAICVSMDEPSSSSSSSSLSSSLGGRAIDRHNPIICDGRRAVAPINPNPLNQLHNKTKKGSYSNNNNKDNEHKRNKSQAKLVEYIKTVPFSSGSASSSSVSKVIEKKSWASKKGIDLVTPPGSSRYLLGDTSFVDGLSESNHDIIPSGNNKTKVATTDSSSHLQSKPSISNQVVVLRVSLHCKGCEGKVRKHLSRMEGVKSFNIDFAAKKVTVIGDVSPVSVLASISKVKNAQILTSLSPLTNDKHVV